MGQGVDRFIAREKIKHFRFLIERATDAAEKEALLKMLAEKRPSCGLPRRSIEPLEKEK